MGNQTVAGFRLSNQQERTWSQHTGTAAPYWSECELVWEGPVDAEKLRDAVRGVVARHEILRTVFHRQTGLVLPFQVILEPSDFAWQSVDLSGLDETSRHARISELVAKRDADIDLEKGPMLQVVLAKIAPAESLMVISLPALCGDLRTLQNLTGEISEAYRGAVPAEDVMQYADVAEWQAELLGSDESKAGRDYWKSYCQKIDFSLLDSPLAPFESKSEGAFDVDIVETWIDVKALGSHAGASLHDFLLACWLVFLSRMTGAPDITVGCYFDGRSYTELAGAFGAFARYLPLHSSFSGDAPLQSVLQRVQHDMAEFRSWQDSFSWTSAVPDADKEHGPTLPLAFQYSEVPDANTAASAKLVTVRQQSCSERFKLELATTRRGEQLGLGLRFDRGSLRRDLVERWSRHFLTFVVGAATAPETPVGRLPLLSEADRRQLLVDWNQTSAQYPRELCIQQLFEAQAARTPDAPALRFQDDCLSYGQLNERANQLAHFLRSKGVGPDSLVGVALERSMGMMVAVLAILKAGGAYVPLSADHPKSRLAQQLVGATAVITEGKFECLMPAFSGATILIDRDREKWSTQPLTNPELTTGPEQFAYVIYTSGSTGTPKGVAVRHRNLVNYTAFIEERLELEKYGEPLHFATVSTLGADLGNTCIYPSLVSGGCLHVIAHDVASDSQRLKEYAAKYPFDVLKIVPSHLLALLNSGGGREVLPRKVLITGGEALTIPLVEKIGATGAACELLNHYGPTETTVGSLTLRVKEFDWASSSAQTIPIGRPIANTRIYVLDSDGDPVPIGVGGELYIAGDGVTAGYIDQPERTAERFVPEKHGPDPSARMYRTGDLVRYLPDGNIEFLGRADDQVKIRGFRIELGEIESVLLKFDGVKQAVVLAQADERGDKSLVAYVVGSAAAADLRTHLRTQLPDYMVPSAIIDLPKLPLTSNGKIDRQALPKPEDVATSDKEPVAPRTPTEEVVASIWAEVLKRENISVEDNFFEIGGHSLLATQIASRLREHFQTPVAVRTVFETPTVAELARKLDTVRRVDQGLVPPPITPVSRTGSLPLSFAQERLWVLDRIEPNNPLYNIPRALRLKGALQTAALERALNEIVRRHESQRTTFAVVDGHPVQVIASSLSLPLVVEDLTGSPDVTRESEARRIAIDESMQPFDLTKGPLVRVRLLKLGDSEHVLLLTMHHIISDAWSAGIFVQELGALYEAFAAGKPSPLSDPAVQYADYAAQERGWLQGEVLDKQLAFWRDRLKGAPAVIKLPLDRPRPENRSYAGGFERILITPETLGPLKELARQEGATLFMTLMAVFQTMLSKYSGDEQIVVGTDLANRTTPETERMIGFFINLLAVRTDLSGNPTFRELLGRVRNGLLESYAHQEVPFPKIVQDVQPERSATHNPLVQVLFVMQNVPRAKREMAGLQLEPYEVPATTSKFDMAVFVNEKPEGLTGYWVYSTELFDTPTIQRMIRHFSNLAQNVAAQPDARLTALAMLTPEEIAQQEEEKKKRKQASFSKLKSTAPTAVGLAHEDGK